MSNQIHSLLQQAIDNFQQGNLSQTKLALNNILKIQPKNFQALLIMGVTLGVERHHAEAINFLLKAAKINAQDYFVNFNLAKALSETGDDFKSIKYHQLAINIDPHQPEAWLNFGKSLFQINRLNEALSHFDKAIQLNPKYPEAWSNKGMTFFRLKRFDEAISSYNQAIQLKPDCAENWSNKGLILHELKLFNEALFHYNHATKLKPDYAEGWLNLADTLSELNEINQAISYYDKALKLNSHLPEAWFNKGSALIKLKKYDEAATHYKCALDINPKINWALGYLIYTNLMSCNWENLNNYLETLNTKLLSNEKALHPFTLLALNDDPLIHKKSSEIFTESNFSFYSCLCPIQKRPKNHKITIGYFSADFHNHAVSNLIAEIFELHDKNKYEIIGFSFIYENNDDNHHRIKNSFNQFYYVNQMSDLEVAKLGRSLNIDIAVDLMGFTQNSRTGIFTNRVAPIQINYLGYPSTMGANFIDYIIADKTLIPPDFQKFYSEKIIYLPNSYQANDRKRLISKKIFTRQELGLPEHGFVFCCFNNSFKISPKIFSSWMRILKSVEGSVLWLIKENESVVNNLRREATIQGVDSNRLIFAEKIELSDHLARHFQADLFLDTLPYNAHTTASDALWTGLPLLTILGRSFAGRVAASLLSAIKLPELITTNLEDYEIMAIELANNQEKLLKIKRKLLNNLETTPLFDSPLLTKNLEDAYLNIYNRYHANLKTEHVFIS